MGNHILSLTVYPYLCFPSATQFSHNPTVHRVPWVWLALDHIVQGIKQNTTGGPFRAGTVSLPHHRSYRNLGNKNESTSKKSHLGCPASSLLELQWLLGFWNNVAQKAGLPGNEFLLLGSGQLLSLPAFSLHWQFIGCPTPIFFFLLNFLFSGQALYLTHLAVYFLCTWARTCQLQGKKRAVPHWTCHSATALPVNIKIQRAWEMKPLFHFSATSCLYLYTCLIWIISEGSGGWSQTSLPPTSPVASPCARLQAQFPYSLFQLLCPVAPRGIRFYARLQKACLKSLYI